MSKSFKFSIVISLFESQIYLKESLDSIINQSFDFKENVQIILIDNGSLDNSLDIINQYKSKYPENILSLSKNNEGSASSIKFALDHVEGEYVNFLEANDKLSSNTLSEVYDCFSKNEEIDMAEISICEFDNDNNKRYLRKYPSNVNKSVDLIKEPFNLYDKFYSSFFKTNILKNHISDIIEDANKLVIYSILVNNPNYGLITTATYYYRKRTGAIAFSNNNSKKRNLNDKFKLFFLPLIDSSINDENKVPEFIQHIIVRDIRPIVNVENLEDYFDEEDEIKEFWNYFYKVLSVLDSDFIYSNSHLNYSVKLFLIYLKNNKEFHVRCVPEKSRVFFETDNYIIRKLHKTNIVLDIVDFNNGVLNFTGGMDSTFNNDFHIEAIKIDQYGNETVFKAKTREYLTSSRRSKKCLGIWWRLYYHFDVDIPIKENEICEIKFRVVFHNDNEDIIMYNKIKFRQFAGISNLNNYFIKNSRVVSFGGKIFYSQPYSYNKMIKLELKSIKKLIRTNESHLFTGIFYRLLRLLSFPFMKNKKIWLFIDRDVFADDNAEHLFKYSVKQDDDIKKYFIINKTSPDFKRLKEFDKHIVPFRSFKHKFLYLFADRIISSQIIKSFANPFIDENSYIYEGMSKHDFAFLQHGVTKDDISSWIRKYGRNIRFFVTASDLERDSILNGYYNYSDEVVQTVGFPRFDNLKNDSKKEILFIPTWRRSLYTEDKLINSDFLKYINSFLNNEKLITALKNKGYKLVFRPHPDLWKFIHLFKISDDIRISDEPYQDMFRDISLMITDYSSVFFDFAYLKKPIIYYQKDDYHYKNGYFDYETMGFGEVFKEEDELVDKIIEYLDNDCKIKEEYKERVDKFFKYTDKNNCKRCYDWIKNNNI